MCNFLPYEILCRMLFSKKQKVRWKSRVCNFESNASMGRQFLDRDKIGNLAWEVIYETRSNSRRFTPRNVSEIKSNVGSTICE